MENIDLIKNNPKDEEEFYKKAYYNYHSYFPYLINNSLLITFDSYLEYKLQLIFRTFNAKQYKIRSKQSTIDYYSDNILSKFGINQNDVINDWKLITDLHFIRNKIAHQNSSLSKSLQPSPTEMTEAKNSKTYKLLKKYSEYIEYQEITTRFYIIDVKFLSLYLNSIRNYLTSILKQVETAL